MSGIDLSFYSGESKTGEKGAQYSYWYASASSGYDSAGDTPIDAMAGLANEMNKALREQQT